MPQTYLRQWSVDGKRIWSLDTVTGAARQLGIADVCVRENFHRVVGPDGPLASYQLRATGQWRPAGADQPNSRRCSSCARAVKPVRSRQAGLRPMRSSSSAMATTPSIQAVG